MSILPPAQLRQSLAAKGGAFGSLISRDECDQCLRDLALIVPRAGLGPDEVARLLDLYFGMFRKYGVTKTMLMAAMERFIMSPKKGKPRFFPAPGELYEWCAEEAENRRRSVAAFHRAIAIIDGKAAPVAESEAPVSAETMRAATAKMFETAFKAEAA